MNKRRELKTIKLNGNSVQTCWDGNFWSHWYLGKGLPSAEQVMMVLLWTPTVPPPVTLKILGASENEEKKTS
jgi:hypothetical protein